MKRILPEFLSSKDDLYIVQENIQGEWKNTEHCCACSWMKYHNALAYAGKIFLENHRNTRVVDLNGNQLFMFPSSFDDNDE